MDRCEIVSQALARAMGECAGPEKEAVPEVQGVY